MLYPFTLLLINIYDQDDRRLTQVVRTWIIGAKHVGKGNTMLLVNGILVIYVYVEKNDIGCK